MNYNLSSSQWSEAAYFYSNLRSDPVGLTMDRAGTTYVAGGYISGDQNYLVVLKTDNP